MNTDDYGRAIELRVYQLQRIAKSACAPEARKEEARKEMECLQFWLYKRLAA